MMHCRLPKSGAAYLGRPSSAGEKKSSSAALRSFFLDNLETARVEDATDGSKSIMDLAIDLSDASKALDLANIRYQLM